MKPSTHIAISDCPYSGLKRAVYLEEFKFNQRAKSVTLTTYVDYFLADQNQSDGYGNQLVISFQKPFVANNETVVDSQGNLVNVEADGVSYFGEYDFYNMIKNTQQVIINNLLTSVVVRKDQTHQFDVFKPYAS